LTDGNDTDTIQSHQDNGPKMTLIIHHQFPGVELVSPVYFSLLGTCCLSPDQCVDAGSTMQASFNIDPDENQSTGILMYKLQRKNIDQPNVETISNEETKCIQLVIIWNVDNSKEFYINSLLIEHDEGHVWDRVMLMSLAFSCELFSIQYGPIEETYLMYDNTVLMTCLNAAYEEEYYKLEMTISEASIKNDTQRPLYFDLDRWVSMMMLVTIFTYNVYY
jgi:hypothetical protein